MKSKGEGILSGQVHTGYRRRDSSSSRRLSWPGRDAFSEDFKTEINRGSLTYRFRMRVLFTSNLELELNSDKSQ